MRVVVVGSGAREHALVRSLLADPAVSAVVAGPGNPGMALSGAECREVDLAVPAQVAELATGAVADLVVIGPEAPLVSGAADAVRAAGLPCVGPDAAAARIEGSKAFAKEVMAAAGVPTASAAVCDDLAAVRSALAEFGPPHVVKDDGLAGGKGVVVTSDPEAALAHAERCLAPRAAAGSPAVPGRVVVEEYLAGPELSVFCLCDGRDVVALAPAQDYKRLRDGDAGPNTGGMGAYSPLTWLPEGLVSEVVDTVARPVVAELGRRGTPYVGVLYCGLALTGDGLRVVEFNARLGDPEAQVVLARLRTPLAELLLATAQGGLAGHLDALGGLDWAGDAAVVVVLAAAGYPGAPRAGDPVVGLAEVAAVPGAHVLHAGTTEGPGGGLVTSGGRLLSVVGTGPDVASARSTAYAAADRIRIEGAQRRDDIAASLPAPPAPAGDAPA